MGDKEVKDETDQKPVAGFDGRYYVTRDGRVISYVGTNTKPGHVLGRGGRNKYCRVMLRQNGRTIPTSVHRIVCEAFNGPPPSPNHVVNHKNGIKSDNRAENLEWVTQRENVRHAWTMGLSGRKIGHDERAMIKRLYAAGFSQVKIGRAMGLSASYVSQICTDWHMRRKNNCFVSQ